MKILDRYKISLHNIKNNKSRSILTAIIVYVISLLIMVILSIGISFSSNTKNIIEKYYQSSIEPVTVEYHNYGGEHSTRVLDNDVYATLSPILDEHGKIISYTKYRLSSGEDYAVIQEHRFPISAHIEIIEGNNVNSAYSNTNKVLVSALYAQRYYDKTKEILNPGSTIDYEFKYEIIDDENNRRSASKNLELEVVGIYKTIDIEGDNNVYDINVISESADIIVDVKYLMNNVPGLYFTGFSYFYDVSKTNFDSDELQNNLDSFVSELGKILPRENPKYDSVGSNALQDLKMSKLIGVIIISLASFLGLILILLSIGSLANTIMISVDKNKKFIGLLKALGLNQKDLKSTIKMESITTIILGIVLAFTTVFLFKGIVGSLNELLLSSMFADYLANIEYTIVFSFPIYIPLIVIVFFISFTLLFARKSMSKIAKTDPMAVISEVA